MNALSLSTQLRVACLFGLKAKAVEGELDWPITLGMELLPVAAELLAVQSLED